MAGERTTAEVLALGLYGLLMRVLTPFMLATGGTVAQILAACDKAAGGLSAAACVAYGWYAGMPLLQQMAERLLQLAHRRRPAS